MAPITEVRGQIDWRGSELADRTDWRWELDSGQQAELLAALAAAEADQPRLADIRTADFPLPTLGRRFAELRVDLINGRGFALVTGVPVAGLAERQCEILAIGIGRHIGSVVAQGPDGALLRHVRDVGVDPAAPTSRSYQHNQRISFHADPTDVVGLLCVRPARSGGLSSIISSVAVHNEIVRTRPDLAELLYQPWWHDHRNGDGPDSFSQRPLYRLDAHGRVSAAYGLDYLRSAQRGAGVPRLTTAQSDTIELLDALTNDPSFALTMDLRAGDMQFLNNHVVMHNRTEYTDHPEPERRRDLIRLWLDA